MSGLLSGHSCFEKELSRVLYILFHEEFIMKLRIFSAVILVMGLFVWNSTLANSQSWNYAEASGSAHWSTPAPDDDACNSDCVQSPVNMNSASLAGLPDLDIHYLVGPATVEHMGHTLEVRSDTEGRIIMGEDFYEFVQLHVHTLSEKQSKAGLYPIVAHLVHRNQNGEWAVVVMQFKEGAENPVLAQLFAAAPARKGETLTLGYLDISQLFPAQRDYYTHKGSLKAPSCIDCVRWHVLKTPVEMSKAQLHTFQLLFPANTHPVQPGDERTAQVSD